MASFTSPDEFEKAYSTLHATFATGITKSIQWRKWQLKQLWWMIDDNEDAFCDALHQDLHRHSFESRAVEIPSVKSGIIEMLDNLEKWAKGEAPPDPGFFFGTIGKAWIRKEPLGVALIIGAWNFPVATIFPPAVAAIAAGNCLMLKPSELSGATQNLLAELVPKYLDTSAITVVTGGPSETGFILEHKFNHIFYTGGSKVGRIIAGAAAKHLTPVVLELGGQAPAIVTKSADIDLTAKRLANTKLFNYGQVCLNVNHVFVDSTIHDEFVERTIYWMKQFSQDKTDGLPRIINERHFDRINRLLEGTKGKTVYGGSVDRSQKFIHPMIVTNVDVADSLISEELFAPILPIIKADVSAALSTIKPMPHPLALYIFSKSKAEIDYILDNTNSGGVTINDAMFHAGVPSAPFGGVGESGYGAFHGKYGFDAFSHDRTVVTMAGRWVESLLSWRYQPWDMKNVGKLPTTKATFKRGETMQDQLVGGSNWTDTNCPV
ncbi:hypothetical protein ASPWEDRAFT_51795 [Aspergillus wentii DTO 134E9]|uniref:Aldehyde dehydrogenase n=1 Tax=Aspergillus wentii DTO 134E9 TaxID=1073089 RepID=A0A1L9RLQ0_ASPWE|nr:uncharacterized protein ASPWEDRAFT_51795 [Aspergillus wentii DTO 134E9]OJJ35851.1 hypothetical protein ASPWEDRAFT_51795 [Aspergillus wentii DTO 134E9]